MEDKNVKLDKALLSTVFEQAHINFIQNKHSDGKSYFTHRELIASAYAEAVIAVLYAQGFEIVKRQLSIK